MTQTKKEINGEAMAKDQVQYLMSKDKEERSSKVWEKENMLQELYSQPSYFSR